MMVQGAERAGNVHADESITYIDFVQHDGLLLIIIA
jgi:hypothetical protein